MAYKKTNNWPFINHTSQPLFYSLDGKTGEVTKVSLNITSESNGKK